MNMNVDFLCLYSVFMILVELCMKAYFTASTIKKSVFLYLVDFVGSEW